MINHVDKPLITSSSTPLPRRNTPHVSSKFSLSTEVVAPAFIQYDSDMARRIYDTESLSDHQQQHVQRSCSLLPRSNAQYRTKRDRELTANRWCPLLDSTLTSTRSPRWRWYMKAFAMKYNQTDKTVEISNIGKSNELRCPWWWWWLKRIFMTMPATLILRVTLVEKKDFLTIILEEFILTFGKVFFFHTKDLFQSFWFFFIIIMLRYDNVCETLAVRILNIKNIPKNNKEVGNLSLNIIFFLYLDRK